MGVGESRNRVGSKMKSDVYTIMDRLITSRGKQRERIFWDTKDRERLKTILERTKERYGYLLHAYVLMENHY